MPAEAQYQSASKSPQHKKAAAYKEGPQFEEGDASKGRIEPEEAAYFHTSEPLIAMRDRRAYLLDQAAKNESANDEINAHQVEANKRLAEVIMPAEDPDELRDETVAQSLEEIDSHTPEAVDQARAFRQQLLAKRAGTAGTAPATHKPAPTAPPPPKDK